MSSAPEWIPLLLFAAAGVLITLLGNLWGPLAVYRLRLRGRPAWAAAHGYSFGNGRVAEQFVADQGSPGIFGLTRKNLYFDLVQAGDFSVVDYAYVRELGGAQPGEKTGVRRAATVVVTELDQQWPSLKVRPWGRLRAARRLVEALPQFSADTQSFVQAMFSSIETGDMAFDETFQVNGSDAADVRTILSPGVREMLLRRPTAELQIDGRTLLVFEERILGSDDLTGLSDLVLGLRGTFAWNAPAITARGDYSP